MRKAEIRITTFAVVDGFMVDIVHTREHSEPLWEAWLYRKDYGVKDLMFGAAEHDQTFAGFVDLVIGNVAEYIKCYIEEHMLEDMEIMAQSIIAEEGKEK